MSVTMDEMSELERQLERQLMTPKPTRLEQPIWEQLHQLKNAMADVEARLIELESCLQRRAESSYADMCATSTWKK